MFKDEKSCKKTPAKHEKLWKEIAFDINSNNKKYTQNYTLYL